MIKVPELTKQLADDIAKTAKVQLRTSRMYKIQRMRDISESEDLYFGIVKKTLRNPFNESFPFMSGFVDTLLSKLDDSPVMEITPNDEADYNCARKYQAAIDQEAASPMPNAQWALKDRWVKKNAIFSGVGIYCAFGEKRDGNFIFNLQSKDYYDFHCEPAGGGDLESHLFCGEEGLFKTKEELVDMAQEGYYDAEQVHEIVTLAPNTGYKQNEDEYNQRLNRHRGMGLDIQSNNYTGQQLYKLCPWYLTFMGVRWYCLFDEFSGRWLRVKPLRETLPPVPETGEALWPYLCFHTHEDGRVFWSKAPADDARPIAKTVNRLLNQELYNREKQNVGQRAYDPDMFYDTEALADWRPDGLVPFDSKGGTRNARDGLYEFKVGDLNTTINMVQFLDSFTGQKTGTTPASQGNAPSNQQATVFLGELKQVEGRLGLYNKSYKEAWTGIALRYIQAVDLYVDKPMAIKMYGSEGVEWAYLSAEDKQRERAFGIKIKGGQEESEKENQKNQLKIAALSKLQAVNPKWKETEILKASGFTSDEIKDAFNNLPPASQELISEAMQALNDIARGKEPKLNQSASKEFAQKIIDEAEEINDVEIQDKAYDYVIAHAEIIARNEARRAMDFINQKNAQVFDASVPGMQQGGNAPAPAPMAPGAPAPMPMQQ